MPEQNITQITPASGRAIAAAVRQCRTMPADRRAVPNAANSVFKPLPTGSGQYKCLMLIDALTPGTPGYDWPRFH